MWFFGAIVLFVNVGSHVGVASFAVVTQVAPLLCAGLFVRLLTLYSVLWSTTALRGPNARQNLLPETGFAFVGTMPR
jgi:hypothetical protein